MERKFLITEIHIAKGGFYYSDKYVTNKACGIFRALEFQSAMACILTENPPRIIFVMLQGKILKIL